MTELGIPGSDLSATAMAAAGERIRQLRKTRRLTLADLAGQAGISPSMLSMVERGVANASIGTLFAVASALELQISQLFEHAEDAEPVTRRASQPEVETADGVIHRMVVNAISRGLEISENEYEPGATSAVNAVRHGGEEFGIVIAGSLIVELDGVEHHLECGDSIRYLSSVPHKFTNRGTEVARTVWVNLAD